MGLLYLYTNTILNYTNKSVTVLFLSVSAFAGHPEHVISTVRWKKIQLNAAHQFLDPFQSQGNRDTRAHCVTVNGGDLLRSRLL